MHVTLVVPRLNVDPLAGEHVSDLIPDPSDALALNDCTTVVAGETGLYVPLSGHPIIGLVVSLTRTLNEHDVDFPTLSVTLHVTAVVPRPNQVPFG